MNSKLLSTYGKLQIPEALTLDHEELRAELIRAAREPGRIGKFAERVARLCQAHFDKEEINIFRAFGLLHDLASDRMRPDMGALAQIIAEFSTQHDSLHEQHQAINVALGQLLQEARKQENKEIAELVHDLRNHETIEDEVMYPTVLQIARSVQQGMGI